jgi:hypothetical protein
MNHLLQAGSEVMLFAMSSDEKVAKAIVVSVNPNNMLAGEALGKKFCEVIVDLVFKGETLVPCPYADIKTLRDAVKMPLAWPFNRVMSLDSIIFFYVASIYSF